METVWSEYLALWDKIWPRSKSYMHLVDMHASEAGDRMVLDSGAGTGNLTLKLLENGASVVAYDTDSVALEILRQKCSGYGDDRLTVYECDANRLLDWNEYYDAVNSMLVVHAVEDPRTYLREQIRVLKPGGELAISGITPPESTGDRSHKEHHDRIWKVFYNEIKQDANYEALRPDVEKCYQAADGVVRDVKVFHGFTLKEMHIILGSLGVRQTKKMELLFDGAIYFISAIK